MMVLFYVVFLGRGVVLEQRTKIKTLPSSEGKKKLNIVAEKFFRLIWVLYAVYITAYALHVRWLMWPTALHSKILDSAVAQTVGVTAIAVGYMWFVWAILTMGNSWRRGVDYKNPGALVTKGPFKISRNPVFLFFDVYFVATFLINGTWFFLILAAYMLPAIHFQILREEKSLATIHGQPYLDYKSRTRRYL
jgi:protein-S-isoprenylcysteine O-methyltransferase Ste14